MSAAEELEAVSGEVNNVSRGAPGCRSSTTCSSLRIFSRYYQIYNMLSAEAEIRSLNVQRKNHFCDALKTCVGKKEYDMQLSTAFFCNMIGRIVCGGKATCRAAFVDTSKIAAAKEAGNLPPGVDFVSTNDVLVSRLARLSGVRIMEVAVNFRNPLHLDSIEGR